MKKMFKHLLVFVLVLPFAACSTSTPVSTSAPVEEQRYLSAESQFATLVQAEIGPFPDKNSPVQKAEERALLKWQKIRTKEDCARANTEVVVNLRNLYGKPYGQLQESQIQTLEPFIAKIQREFGPFIGVAKRSYSRLRPYEYIKGLKPCLPTEPSFAYPSGHATLAEFYALILMDVFPQQEAQLRQRSSVIARDRIIGGVHHPTDIESGKKLGQMMYFELKKSKLYQDDVARYQKALN